MSEAVSCPTCGAPARRSDRPGSRPAAGGEPALIAVTDEEMADKVAQLKEVVRLQKERLDTANQRVRDLEEILRQETVRPGVVPDPTAPTLPPPGFPRTPFQGKAGVF